ncbi:MAG TPA: sigma-70 family RNA polymerase sigma factor [Polyangia bacterium]|nr:sigma-70 family RNA polymerase sigma factor [Polyangia bacterium]
MWLASPTSVTRDERLRFEHTALKLRGELRRAAERMAGGSRAEDLVQETLLRAFASWERVEPGSNPRAWMHAILRNTFINQLRRGRREIALTEEVPDRDRTLDWILALDLARALRELPEPLRQTLLAVDAYGLAYREVAARAKMPVGTVMSRLHRARRRMAAKLAA